MQRIRAHDMHPEDIYHPYLDTQFAGSDTRENSAIPALHPRDNGRWQSNPWMRERERLANGEPVPGINTPLYTQFMVPAHRPGSTPDGIIYQSPHCGCVDCRTGGLGLSKDCDGYYIARSADHYQGEFGPTLTDVYGPAAHGVSGSARNKAHSRVMSGADSGVLYPNYDPEMHDQRIHTRWLGDSGRQLAPVAFGQPVTFRSGCGPHCDANCRLHNEITVLYKIPNTGRSKDQFEFRERTGYTPMQMPIKAPRELQMSNIAECNDAGPEMCLHGRTGAFSGPRGSIIAVPGANANSIILPYKPCYSKILADCRQ